MHPESVKKSAIKFRRKNKKILKIYHQDWYQRNKKKHDDRSKEYVKKNPWGRHYNNARQRCVNPKRKDRSSYKGIKFLMTVEDFKFLWFRDKAFNLRRPSIDRVNPRGDYIISNCRFLEMRENCQKK